MAIINWDSGYSYLYYCNTINSSVWFVCMLNNDRYKRLINSAYTIFLVYSLEDEVDAKNVLIALRIIMGLAGGTTLPSLTVLIAAWIPENERSRLGAFVLGGTQVSTNFTCIHSKKKDLETGYI